MITEHGLQLTILCRNDEPHRITRLVGAMQLAFACAEANEAEDEMARLLISVADHKGTLIAQWSPDVWETDNLGDPDMPELFAFVERAWKAQGEGLIRHTWGEDGELDRDVWRSK